VEYPDFKLRVDNVQYSGISFLGNLYGTSVANGGMTSGQVHFYDLPKSQTDYNFSCSMSFANSIFSHPTLGISKVKHVNVNQFCVFF
jgi:hypothetical protein